jgi:hypothetical protein
MKPRPAAVRAAGVFCFVASDALMALGLVVAGLLAWSPRIGIQAARQTIAERRARRQRIAEIGRNHGAVWARHARRCPEIFARYRAHQN